jgi:hypothetical protein
MFDAIDPLGRALTELPAGPSHPGLRAGPAFRLSRGAGVPTHQGAAWVVFHERLTELQRYSRFLQTQAGAPKVLGSVGEALGRFASTLAV